MGTAARGLLPAAHPTEQRHILWMHVAGDLAGRMLSSLLPAAALERSSVTYVGSDGRSCPFRIHSSLRQKSTFSYSEDQADLTWSSLSWMMAVMILRIYT